MGHNSLRSSVIPAASLGTRLAPPPNNRGLFLGCIRQVSRTQSPKIEGDVNPPSGSMHSHSYHRTKLLKPSFWHPADTSWCDSSSSNAVGHPRATTQCTRTHSHTHPSIIHTSLHMQYVQTPTYTLRRGNPPLPLHT